MYHLPYIKVQKRFINSKSCVSVKRSAGRSDDKWERGESDAVDEIEEEEEEEFEEDNESRKNFGHE